MDTIDYYNNNAQAFYDRTIHTNLSEIYDKFLRLLPEKAHILDAGCGVGRDTKYFLGRGHQVIAFDASPEMVRYASQETNQEILLSRHQAIAYREQFDGVWAQASLLHVPYEETGDVYEKIYHALKPGGVFFASYKYGDAYMPTVDRDFYNMTESTVLQYFAGLFDPIEIWKAADTRSKVAMSPDKAWLNFIVRKRL
jgi:SAM-dependent methyltransferase